MKAFIRKTSLALAAVMLLSACSETTAKEEEKPQNAPVQESVGEEILPEDADPEETRMYDEVPEMDLQGDTFTFLTYPERYQGYWSTFEFYTEEITGVALNDAIYNRNEAIAGRFNLKFDQMSDLGFESLLTKSVTSGMDEYDLAALPITTAGTMATKGHLTRYSELTYIDLDKPWWDPRLNQDIRIAGKQYSGVGALSLVDKEATYLMMFNKDVARDNNIDDLYTLVREGEWTVEKQCEICEAVTRDLNGDGNYNFYDCVGIVTDDGATYQAMFYSAGCGFFEKDENDLPYYSIDLYKASEAVEKIQKVVNADFTMMASTLSSQGVSNPWSDEGLNGMFKEGRALFYGISLTVMNRMRDMDSDFGVIPYPKIVEGQEDYIGFMETSLGDSISVPITAPAPEVNSAVIEALCCESMYSTLPAYYDVTITNKTMRDQESAEMLDYIFDHRNIDLSQVYNWGNVYSLLLTDTARNADRLASSLKKTQRSITRAMEATLSEFAD